MLSSNFDAHDEFEAALRCYGNDSMIQEFDSLSSSSPNVKHRLLETLADMTRDTLVQKLQDSISLYSREEWEQLKQNEAPCNMQCPLVQALIAYPMNINSLYDSFLDEIRTWLSHWGRRSSSSNEENMKSPQHQIEEFEKKIKHHKERTKQWRKQQQEEKNDGNDVGHQTSKKASSVNDDDMNDDEPLKTKIKVHQQEEEEKMQSEKEIKLDKEKCGNNNDDNHWESLKPIQIQDLQLFDTCEGCVLEGTLVTEPFTPMVGCTTLLQDASGDIVLLALYNFLPNGINGNEAELLAQQKIPKGSHVKISEPFLKIFRDGSRGIRIDNPRELCIEIDPAYYGIASLPSPETTGATEANNNSNKENNDDETTSASAIAAATTNYYALVKCKTDGNFLFCKQLYHAASETYINGLRKDDMTATLLSNRAQTYINLEDWSNALADAAASLVLRPNCIRTLSSYRASLTMIETMSMMQQPQANATTTSTTSPLHKVLTDILIRDWNPGDGAKRGGSAGKSAASEKTAATTEEEAPKSSQEQQTQFGIDTIERLNVRGNIAFRRNDYHGAKNFYSQALGIASNATHATQAILCNWSLCSLMMGSIHDAFAASMAALRMTDCITNGDGGTITAATRTLLHHLVKSLLLLGEPLSAIHILREFPCRFNGALLQASKRLETLLQRESIQQPPIQEPRNVIDFPPSLLPNWSSPKVHTTSIESCAEGKETMEMKQPSVKALCDIAENEVILIERSLIWCKTNENNNAQTDNGGDRNQKNDNKGSGADMSQSHKTLGATIMDRLDRDGLVSNIIDKLDGGIELDRGAKRASPSLPQLLATDGDIVPLLLPSHHEYVTNDRRVLLTSKRVGDIVRMHSTIFHTENSNALNINPGEESKSNTIHQNCVGRIELFPALSMFRRSSPIGSSHNCICHHRQQGTNSIYIVTTSQKVTRGEELIIQTQTNAELL